MSTPQSNIPVPPTPSMDHQLDVAYHRPAPKVLQLGMPGKGKTYAIGTFIEAGITPFIIFTEPHMDVMERYLKEHNIDESDGLKVHWKYIPCATLGWDAIKKDMQLVNSMSYSMLTKQEDSNKSKHGQMLKVIDAMANFVSDRDGKSYGGVESWNTDRCLVWDTLSGISIMQQNLVVGSKPIIAPGEWNIMMTRLEGLLNKIVTDLRCWVVVNAHMEREKDEITGAIKLMPQTLGAKLPPKVGRFFTDVIEAYTPGEHFMWRTMSNDADLKPHHLPLWQKELPQNFGALVKNYVESGGQIQETAS